MCGIAGWIDYNKDISLNEKTINAMSETLKRRGPDDKGLMVESGAALIHRRLIVIDPLNGVQPMTKTAKNDIYTIIYNGELYNTDELQKKLLSKGYSFKGHSDTEVLLTAFIEWEEKCLEKLNGIYAFAVWKHKEKSLFAARDRIGVKPFYYYKYNGGIIFASEIKTLLANPIVKPEIDNEGLKQIFLLGPGKICGSGIIKGVKELMPSEYFRLNSEKFYVKKYWKLKAVRHTENFQNTVEQTRFLITDAIKRQLVSDVPLACFLSGGLDSSIISMIAAKEYKEKGKTLTTYSVDYVDSSKDFVKNSFQPDKDNAFIAEMVNYIKSDHKNIILDNTEVAKALTEAADARDMPGMADIDSSLLLFCREIKKQNTVCVSGECADEIFGGYPWYHREEILRQDTFPWSNSLEMRKNIVRKGLLKGDLNEFVQSLYNETVKDTDVLPDEDAKTKRMRQMFNLNFYWFMQTLLDRKDRMSMYSGLEVRVPFCDHRLVEYAYNMPWEFKSYNGREKGIVREAFRELLPEKIVWRKKSPYPKTFNPLYYEFVKNKVIDSLDGNGIIPQLVDRNYVKELSNLPPYKADPWYGQLMQLPQVFAYILQIEEYFKKYNLTIV
jgi:asparagine synthase (glutamine-hydrolysing)